VTTNIKNDEIALVS